VEERVDEDLEAGRVACQLEEAHDADDAEELEYVVLSVELRQQKVEVEGDGGDEVDDVDGRTKESDEVRTDGEANDQLEREPSVARALDVEERQAVSSPSTEALQYVLVVQFVDVEDLLVPCVSRRVVYVIRHTHTHDKQIDKFICIAPTNSIESLSATRVVCIR